MNNIQTTVYIRDNDESLLARAANVTGVSTSERGWRIKVIRAGLLALIALSQKEDPREQSSNHPTN